MKICNECGRKLDDSVNFCPKCGAAQPKNPIKAETPKSTPESETTTNKSLNEGRIITVLGIAVILYSMSLPLMEISTMYRYSMLNLETFSKPMTMIFQATCVMAIYGLVTKKYPIITIAGSGLVFYFIGIMSVYMYLCLVSKMVLMKIAFGTNLLCVGAFMVTIGGVICERSTSPVESGKVFDQWKHDLDCPVVIGGIDLIGMRISLLIAIVLIACTFKADVFKV